MKTRTLPEFVKAVFESNLTTLDLTGHKNLHIFKKDFNPQDMVNLEDGARLHKFASITALMNDHLMELLSDCEKQVAAQAPAQQPSPLVNFFSKQFNNKQHINLNEYFLVKTEGEMQEDIQTIFVYNPHLKNHINV